MGIALGEKRREIQMFRPPSSKWTRTQPFQGWNAGSIPVGGIVSMRYT